MNAMRRGTDALSRALPALLTAAIASIVLGIVGMHALSTHGVIATTDHSTLASPVTSPVTSPGAGAHSDMSGDMSAGSVTSPAAGTKAGMASTAPDGGDGHSLGAMVMLCFATLAAAAGALLLLLVGLRRRPRVWAHRLTVPTFVTEWVIARLGTGPPYVWQFSVIRC